MGDATTTTTLDAQPAGPAKVMDPEEALGLAIAAMQQDRDRLAVSLDSLPAPIYVTDAEGWLLYCNRACTSFAGRTPVPGQDRWCVTWRLYDETGEPMPHDRCPMAVAIKERRPVRDVVAVAERPDGTRVLFVPYPTPILDAAGTMIGAVNMLIDVTDRRQGEALRAQAQRCRRLAQSVMDKQTIDTLLQMAAEYEGKASELGQS